MPETGESFRAGWRRRFERYGLNGADEAQVAGWTRTGLAQRLRCFRRCWRPPASGGTWLDAGCGAGTYSRLLVQHGLAVVGLDYSEPSLRRAREGQAGGIVWVLGDVTRLPLRPASLSGALCLGVTQAMPHSEEIVREAALALRPGGELWIDGLNRWCLPHLLHAAGRRLRGWPPHLRYESPWALRELLRAQGFERLRLFWMPVVPARWARLAGLLDTRAARMLLDLLGPLGAPVSHSFLLRGVRAGEGA